jgi:hypothetical protein
MMQKAQKLLYWLGQQSLLQHLKGVLSPHILRVLAQDQQKYDDCLLFMRQAVERSPLEAKTKCNLIFNAHTVSDSLLHLRPLLSSLVLRGEIRSQYELDQIIKWLSKEIKVNSEIG